VRVERETHATTRTTQETPKNHPGQPIRHPLSSVGGANVAVFACSRPNVTT